MINAVIFDLDGTLINSLPGIANSLNRVLARQKLPTHDESTVRTFIGDGVAKLVERALPAKTSEQQLSELVSMMMADYAEHWKEGSAPYPAVTDTLQTLLDQNISIAVLSNKPDIYCKEITDVIFPNIPFTKVLGQRAEVPAKPDPAGAIELAKMLQTPVRNIAFLGDSSIDIITAKRANMLSIAATWGYHDPHQLEAEKPAHTIHSISEILPLLR